MLNFDYLFNKEYNGEALQKNRHLKKSLGFQFVSNATVLPHKSISGGRQGGGVLDSENTYIPNTGFSSYEPESIQYSNETVIYLGNFYVIWGHMITDNLRRIWFLRSEIYKKYFTNCRIIYLPQDDFEFEKTPYHFHFAKILYILGIDYKNLYPVKEATIYKNLILPDESFYNISGKGKHFTNEYLETIDTIRQHFLKYYGTLHYSSLPFKKVYFFHGMREQVGEERLAAYFQSKGYVIINPYKFSFEEELAILVNCESFASPIGSTAHNSIFLRDNAEVILIPRAGGFLTDYQEALNQLHDLRITYIDSTLSIFSKGWDKAFFYFISNNLKRYFGDEVSEEAQFNEEDFKTFVIYLKNSLSKGLQLNQKAMEYYGDVAKNFLYQLREKETLLQEAGITIN